MIGYIGLNDVCYCLIARKTDRAITKYYDKYFSRIGITSCQFNILVTLYCMPNKSMTDVSNNLGMERTSMSRNVILLKKMKLIVARPQPSKRVKSFGLTNSIILEKKRLLSTQ